MRRFALIAGLVLAIGVPSAASPAAAIGNPHVGPIVDSLAGIATTTAFSVFGSGGATLGGAQSIVGFVSVGPRLALAHRTMITEIGGYLDCWSASSMTGPIGCTDDGSIVVQVRPALDGAPDPGIVLATYALSNDGDPLVASYESASMHLMLPPGTYFAMFALREPGDWGYLVDGAQDPFAYIADQIDVGQLSDSYAVVGRLGAAVRVLGFEVPPRD